MTILIIAITAIISILSFNNRALFYRLQFNAYQVYHRKEVYRLLTHGFVHANWGHLIVNMLVLYFFGGYVENTLKMLAVQGFLKSPVLIYLIMYLSAIVFSSSISLIKFKDNPMYNSVGASGAVSAVVFFMIFFDPWEKLYLYGLIGIPGIIFGVLYLVYAQYMSRRGGDNINHDAHILGAIFGFVFPLFIDLGLFNYFLSQLGVIS